MDGIQRNGYLVLQSFIENISTIKQFRKQSVICHESLLATVYFSIQKISNHKSCIPRIGPSAASFANAVKSLPEYPSVILGKEKVNTIYTYVKKCIIAL